MEVFVRESGAVGQHWLSQWHPARIVKLGGFARATPPFVDFGW